MQVDTAHYLPVKRAHMIRKLNTNRNRADSWGKLAKYTSVLDRVKRLRTCPPGYHYELRYSVIITLTQVAGRTAELRKIGPRSLWDCTDREDTGERHDNDGPPINTQKYCGVLTPQQFHDLCDNLSMTSESHETMGMIGAPGFGIQWRPAIPFITNDHDWYNDTAYVHPFVVAVPNNRKRIRHRDCYEVATDYDKLEKAIRLKFESGV